METWTNTYTVTTTVSTEDIHPFGSDIQEILETELGKGCSIPGCDCTPKPKVEVVDHYDPVVEGFMRELKKAGL